MPTGELTPAEGKYLYCIMRGDEPRYFTNRGIGGRGDVVYTLNASGLAAVVSDSAIIEYDQSRRNMMAHTLVQEEAMQSGPILPIRFGIVAPRAEAIQEQLLARRAVELHGLLDSLEGRQEVGLKAFWYEDVLFQEVIDNNPPIRTLRDSLMGRSAEETYYDRIRLGEMIADALAQQRETDAEYILQRLRPLAEQIQLSKVLNDRMVLNAAFLIEQRRKPEFDTAIDDIDAVMGKRMIFKYVGAAPPYNFVTLTMSWDV
ncbi:MAG: GvpL/GvpF family gas vesicle protein [Chloroflexaceae bacterium]|nr:GvpL/GvpF family gas vesicle protein [Chloroflexaceae bacterium]NJO05591.1 GvpL/GvpF family gas vesicle protein [Chloroflexaceae bacterium]